MIGFAVAEIVDQQHKLLVAVIDLGGGWSAIQQFGLEQIALTQDLDFFMGEENGARNLVQRFLEKKTSLHRDVFQAHPHLVCSERIGVGGIWALVGALIKRVIFSCVKQLKSGNELARNVLL